MQAASVWKSSMGVTLVTRTTALPWGVVADKAEIITRTYFMSGFHFWLEGDMALSLALVDHI